MIDLNGIAHVALTVADLERSRPFYRKLLHEQFGMMVLYDDPATFYCIGGRTGVLIQGAAPEHRDAPFDQCRVGLHHLCFRLRSREDVESLHRALVDMGARIIRPPTEGPWASGYYSILFEDPDGIRLEANFVPGRGKLDLAEARPSSPGAS